MDIIFKILKYLKKYSNLIKNIVFIILFVVCIVQSVQINNYKSSYEEEMKSGLTMETELDSVTKQNNDLSKKLSDYDKIISEKDSKIHQLEEEVKKLQDTVKKASTTQTPKIKQSTRTKETTYEADGNYNQARQVWTYLRDLGLNEYVTAGIIGNIMAEVGGQTLDISRWPQYSNGYYYGICQWADGRKRRLLNDFGTTLEDQIRFLSVELFEVIPKGNSFYSMQDEKEAALYFAKYYERCSSKYYSVRQKNATKALNYFTK